MSKEIWFEIPQYCGAYRVSNFGRVASRRARGKYRGIKQDWRLLKPTINKCGYAVVGIVDQYGNKKLVYVHRLMKEVFFYWSRKQNVNHKNSIRHDNHISNLEPCTQSENLKHAYRFGAKKPVVKKRSLTDSVALEIYRDKRRLFEVAKSFNCSLSMVYHIRNGRTYKNVTNHDPNL